MRYLTLVSFMVLLLSSAVAQRQSAQFPEEMWHLGELTLRDESILKGEVKYDLQADLIQLNTGRRIRTYAANQLNKFRIFQENTGRHRTFYSIPYTNENGYRRPKLFELVFNGNTSLLAREFIAVTRRNVGPPVQNFFSFRQNPMITSTERILKHRLYLINKEGKIQMLGSKRKDVIHSFESNHKELKKFIRKNRLKMGNIEDITTLVRYYNQLDRPPSRE